MRTIPLAPLVLAALLPLLSVGQDWVRMYHDPAVPLDEVERAHADHFAGRAQERGKGRNVFAREAWFWSQRLYPEGVRPDPGAYARAWRQLKSMPVAATPKSASWQPIGPAAWDSWSYNPGNGRVHTAAVSPLDANTIYVGTPSGGLWRTTDGGVNWNALGQDLPTLGITGIALHPTDANTLYIATGDGYSRDTYALGVLKSTDGGATWNATGLDWDVHQVRTTRRLVMHPTDPDVLFCAANSGLYRTTDAGASWQRVALGSFFDVAFKPGDPGVVHATSDQYHRSTDGGATFTTVTSGLPAAGLVVRMALAVTPADPQLVYLLAGREDDGGFRGLYRSTDGGTTFTTRSNTPNIMGYSETGNDSGGQAWYDLALAADPVNAGTIYAGGINVWKSANGGTTWTNMSHWTWPSAVGYTHADIHHLQIANGQLYCGSDGGFFRSPNGGADWFDLSAGLSVSQVYRIGVSGIQPELVMAGLQDNGSMQWESGAWIHVQGGDGMEGLVDKDDPQVRFCSAQYGSIYRSFDGGQTFGSVSFTIPEEGAWVTPYIQDPSVPGRLYAGYNNLWRSNDLGDTWTNISNITTGRKVRAIAVAPTDPDVIYFSNDGALRRSTDGGTTWDILTGLPAQALTAIAIDPTDADRVAVTCSGFREGVKVFRSVDGGDTWTDHSGNLPNVPVNTVVLTGINDGLYVGTDLGVFYRDATLGNWQPFAQGLPAVVVMELELDGTGQWLYAATYGRGVWRTPVYSPSGDPPVAGFRTESEVVCGGGAVTFHDLALEAAPGWSWQFPGGNPGTSTDASPAVTYPASGSYTVSLTVSNAFGSDTETRSVDVQVRPEQIEVALVFDQYAGESAWSIVDDNGLVVATGGPYNGQLNTATLTAFACLDTGCYTFIMHDAYGDGMCCNAGNGSYTVTGAFTGFIADGASFGVEESTPFCVDASVGLPARSAPALRLRSDGDGVYALLGAPAGERWWVLDGLGRVVRDGLLAPAGGELRVDLRDAAAGTYTLRGAGGAGVKLVRGY